MRRIEVSDIRTTASGPVRSQRPSNSRQPPHQNVRALSPQWERGIVKDYVGQDTKVPLLLGLSSRGLLVGVYPLIPVG